MFSSNTSSAAGDANYIEDVFSTYLYTGNGSTQTITNGIDLAGKGGLVWCKSRSATGNNGLTDTVRGTGNSSTTSGELYTDTTTAPGTTPGMRFSDVTSFNSNGFGLSYVTSTENENGITYASWTFRKQPKFFDVVTWTGNDVAGRTVAHNLGSVPGCIIVKRTDTGGTGWQVYHQSLGNTQYTVLNDTAAAATGSNRWNDTTPTSTVFSLGASSSVNEIGGTYVAYLFAHDAGGFGLTGTDNVISCGSFTYNNSVGVSVTLGYEPQWIMYKSSTALGGGTNWIMHDMMRGMPVPPSTTATLAANNSGAEANNFARAYPTANGFALPSGLGAADDYIYIAIRRGPMKVPTTGTSVFSPLARTGTGASATVTGVGFAPDLVVPKAKSNNSSIGWWDRLRGPLRKIISTGTDAEISVSDTLTGFDVMDGFKVGPDGTYDINYTVDYINYNFKRAPGFFDEVCYTGTTPNLTVAHNLAAVPELMIIKQRSAAAGWAVFADLTSTTMRFGRLDTTGSVLSDTYANQGFLTGQPTSSSFTLIGASGQLANNPGSTYVSYLFATCAGVSKVGSYTGTATTLQIDCGFTGGARFVLIKRTDSTGDWYVWDTARGIVSGNDPYLLLNSTAAEVTSTDYIDTFSSGFEISSTAPAAINASGGTFIFLAIA